MTIHHLLLSELNEFLSARIGLYFPKERWCDLERGIIQASSEFGFKDPESCIRWLFSSPVTKSQIEILASYLTVGETFFFRERKIFDALEELILPGLISSRRNKDQYIRIWSAGCCSGEEPYSIAILLHKMIPDLSDWNIAIVATDINPRFLQKASEGVFSEWSFRDAPSWIRRYFRKTKRGLEILPCINKMVTFFFHNLAEDTYPSLLNNTNAMDIIFCRNVLMYFSPGHAKNVVQNLFHSLVDGGWLIVSPVETSQELFSQFVTVSFHEATVYRKDASEFLRRDELNFPACLPLEKKTELHAGHISAPPAMDRKEPFAGGETQPYNEAMALYEKGKYEEAAEKIVEVFPLDHDTKAMALLSRAYANLGKSREALEWCEKAILTDRLNPHYHYLRAMILQERGEAEEAVNSLKRAIYLDPDFVLANYAMGNLCRRQGKPKESDRYFENVSRILRRFRPEQILPESDGITAGRLSEIITSGRRWREFS